MHELQDDDGTVLVDGIRNLAPTRHMPGVGDAWLREIGAASRSILFRMFPR